MSLGELQQLTMLAVIRLGGEAYGAAIREELMRVAGRTVSVQTIWVTLVRLEEQGLTKSKEVAAPEWRSPAAGFPGDAGGPGCARESARLHESHVGRGGALVTARGAEPPKVIRRLLRRVLSGPRGCEVLHDLDAEYRVRRSRSCGVMAGGWYLVQLLRPDTWRLAWLLREARVANATTAALPGRRAYGSGVSLDLKLAWRMLVKSPGLTIGSLLGIVLGTAVGVGFFVVLTGVFFPAIPLAEGHRLVGLSVWDQEASRPAAPSMHAFVRWREGVQSVQQLAAASLLPRALVTDDSPPRTVRTARLTAAGLQVARVPPLLGRTILPEDESAGAPLVAVVGYELWQSRFGGDPAVIGRTIRVDGDLPVVVGVMPPGFRQSPTPSCGSRHSAAPASMLHDRGGP